MEQGLASMALEYDNEKGEERESEKKKQIEEKRNNQEVEIFEKHLSLINHNKETVLKAVEELEAGPTDKISGGSGVSAIIDNLKNI